MAKPSYTPEQKAEALALYAQHGPAEAGRRTGIKSATIASWASRSGVATTATARTAAAVEASKMSFAARRAQLTDDLGAFAAEAIMKGRELIRTGDKVAKDMAVTAAIAIDKAQLLSGGATQRFDVADPEQRTQEALSLRQQLDEARAANGKQVAS